MDQVDMEDPLHYYKKLAPEYDSDRFGNSYGQYLHQQEWAALSNYLPTVEGPVLDLACGTGRFLSFATHGLDQSPEMLEIAKERYPDADLRVGLADATGFPDNYFDLVLSMHFLMHLDLHQSQLVFDEVWRITKPGGLFIFDVPSTRRRKLVGYQPASWHGAGAWKIEKLQETLTTNWTLEEYRGLLAVPIHRLPGGARKWFGRMDDWICQSFLREYASYLLTRWRKK